MVNVMKGVLIECDPAMKQFLLHLDEKLTLGSSFVLNDLDETHLFVTAEIIAPLQEKIDDLMDKMNVPVVDGKQALFEYIPNPSKMIRRDPTRIELTLDDIQEYHMKVKQENEAKRTASKTANSTNLLDSSATGDANSNAGSMPIIKSRAENVHERIGFNPMPRNT